MRVESELRARMGSFAAVALLGRRQIGKTTLARGIADRAPGGVFWISGARPIVDGWTTLTPT
ncbi:hypothetical protein [Nakamurella lactea]|uniref:hypothetical protein n=1 Tax=Nakamurella lactea TaxID=459515 RepID=UPI0003F69148|nr:hypothetical protein [Nakamurella lactea]